MATPICQWLFTEASSGTTPTSIADTATGTAINLTPTYGTGAAWTSIAAGNGLSSGTHVGSDVNGTALRSGSLSGSKLITAFTAKSTLTIELVINVPAGGATNGGTVFEVSDWATQQMMGGTYKAANSHTWEIYDAAGTLCYTVPMPTAGTTTAVQIILDTTQATADNRRRVYYNGVAQTVTTISAIAQNTTYTIGASDRLFMLGGPPSGTPIDWVTTGTIYYAAFYNVALTAGEASANSTALLANNDADPNASSSTFAPPFESAGRRLMRRNPALYNL